MDPTSEEGVEARPRLSARSRVFPSAHRASSSPSSRGDARYDVARDAMRRSNDARDESHLVHVDAYDDTRASVRLKEGARTREAMVFSLRGAGSRPGPFRFSNLLEIGVQLFPRLESREPSNDKNVHIVILRRGREGVADALVMPPAAADPDAPSGSGSDDDDDGDAVPRDSDGSWEDPMEEICPLEAQCNPALDGVFDKTAVLARVARLTAPELAALAERCMCPPKEKCKYRKCVDSDAAWWPHCASAWYEPGMAPEKPGRPPETAKDVEKRVPRAAAGGGAEPGGDRGEGGEDREARGEDGGVGAREEGGEDVRERERGGGRDGRVPGGGGARAGTSTRCASFIAR